MNEFANRTWRSWNLNLCYFPFLWSHPYILPNIALKGQKNSEQDKVMKK